VSTNGSELLAKDLAPISALVLNAGMQVLNEVKTDDGIEAMFAVDHVNQALLLVLLGDELTGDCRIVLISSSAHDPKQGRCSPHYISAEDCARNPAGGADHKTGGLNRYGLSKLANVLFGYGLHDHARRTNKGWISLVLDPGCMATGLYREGTDAGKEMDAFIRSDAAKQMPDLYTVEFTANTVLRLVDSEEFSDIEKSGKYYVADGAKEMPSGKQTQDKDLQKDLWDWTYNEVLDENERSKWLGTKA
jgi:NAD(P)-dependent dehydrogenase (short-subunit alcohol dehydrogenase family)